ncbi:MAG: hypothetical protein OXJ54_00960 [Gemmatimonadetes bacterium]|nr:hypothetical protein [Candidatus Palauibacter rhopaloidicola]
MDRDGGRPLEQAFDRRQPARAGRTVRAGRTSKFRLRDEDVQSRES